MLADAARDAALARRNANAADREAAKNGLIAQARATFNATMRAPDGTLPVTGASLAVAYTDLERRVVILTDRVTAVAVQNNGVWLADDDLGWVRRGPQLRSLADLGETLP